MCLLLFILYPGLFARPASLRIFLQQFQQEQTLAFTLLEIKENKAKSFIYLQPE